VPPALFYTRGESNNFYQTENGIGSIQMREEDFVNPNFFRRQFFHEIGHDLQKKLAEAWLDNPKALSPQLRKLALVCFVNKLTYIHSSRHERIYRNQPLEIMCRAVEEAADFFLTATPEKMLGGQCPSSDGVFARTKIGTIEIIARLPSGPDKSWPVYEYGNGTNLRASTPNYSVLCLVSHLSNSSPILQL